MKGWGANPPTDDMLMTRPLLCARMWGRTALVMRMRPKTLTSKTIWSWATELSSLAPDEPMPALLTRTSMRPNRSITCPTAVATESSLVTSRSTSVTPRPGVAREASRLGATTSNPASTSATAVALPMPDDAPVTRATGCVAFIICLLGILEFRSPLLVLVEVIRSSWFQVHAATFGLLNHRRTFGRHLQVARLDKSPDSQLEGFVGTLRR